MTAEDQAPLSVSATYSLADLYGAIVHSWRRLLRILIILELLWIVFFVAIDVIDGVPWDVALAWLNWKLLGVLAVIVALVWLALCPLVGYVRLKRAELLGPNRFTLVQRGVQVETPKSEAVIYWPAIRRTVRTRKRLYIFLAVGGAIIVPRRAFEHESDFDQFAGVAQRSFAAGVLA